MDALHTDGYVVLRGAIPAARCAYVDGIAGAHGVHYQLLREFIQSDMLNYVSARMNQMQGSKRGAVNFWDAVPMKFRYSDNNNSADAAAFHRDLIATASRDSGDQDSNPYHPANMVYTCLVYFDKAQMQLIPGSHRQNRMSSFQALDALVRKVRTEQLSPGDIVFFHATLLHRGVFEHSTAATHRRLIQLFDVTMSPDVQQRLAPRMLHVRGVEKHSELFIRLSRNVFTGSVMNLFGMWNAATGYGSHDKLFHNICMFSSEGLRGRVRTQNRGCALIVDPPVQPNNKYVLWPANSRVLVQDMDTDTAAAWRRKCYEVPFAQHASIVLLFVIALILLVGVAFAQAPRRHTVQQ